jgi:hypothetical protein
MMTAERLRLGLAAVCEHMGPSTADGLGEHISAQGARVAVLEANAETWRQRVEKAAEALSDVTPGELGRLDLVGRIERLKTEVETMRAQMESNAARDKEQAIAMETNYRCATEDRDSAVVEMERLKAEVERLNTHAGLANQEVTRLKADLEAVSRLTPSGQVAEDEQAVLAAMPSPTLGAAEALSRLAAGAQESESLRARVAELATEVSREQEMRRMEHATLSGEVAAARAEVERLKEQKDALYKGLSAALADRETRRLEAAEARDGARIQAKLALALGEQLRSAESRLAAIRERAADPNVCERFREDGITEGLRWVWEGDAPQEATPCCHPVPKTHEGKRLHTLACQFAPQEELVEVVTFEHGMAGQAQTTEVSVRCPCSPTCTHDDSVNPGHPERVKEGSEARTLSGRLFAETAGPKQARGRSEAATKVIARADDDNTAAESGAERAGFDEGMFQGYDAGAEAMRAACLMAVVERLVRHGLQRFREDFKAAIEGATP